MDRRSLERLKWRSRRGLLELDIVFERFWAKGGVDPEQDDIPAFERMLAMPDNDLLDVVMGRADSDDPGIRAWAKRLRSA